MPINTKQKISFNTNKMKEINLEKKIGYLFGDMSINKYCKITCLKCNITAICNTTAFYNILQVFNL